MPKLKNSTKVLRPFWSTTDGETVRVYQGDVLEVLKQLPARLVQCVVTSPPYWGLRSYLDTAHGLKYLELGSEARPDCLGWARGVNCAEEDWANGCHVCRMVLVFREVRRVLRDDGTLWLNYGDTYGGGKVGRTDLGREIDGQLLGGRAEFSKQGKSDLPSGNLVGIPWRVALALQADGWVLRQDVIWHKPSPMPESVTNRCTKAHEYVFLLAKSNSYYYDAEAIREDVKGNFSGNLTQVKDGKRRENLDRHYDVVCGANKRSVWAVDDERALLDWLAVNNPEALDRFCAETSYKGDVWRVSSAGYPGAHFATFPAKLIEPMVLAGSSEQGCCPKCGAPWERIVDGDAVRYTGGDRNQPGDCASERKENGGRPKTFVGWKPGCSCGTGQAKLCVVLDPFLGSGTTAAVCIEHGRLCWGIELSREYIVNHATRRVEEALRRRPYGSALIKPVEGRINVADPDPEPVEM